MQPVKTDQLNNNGRKVFKDFLSHYTPYWPVFLVLLFISVAGAVLYLSWASPVYEISAAILLKEEKKGFDESSILESLDMFGTKKIVENEIEVLSSWSLMNQVVKDLDLYAPLYKIEGRKNLPAFAMSPVKIEVMDPEAIEKTEKFYFTFDVRLRKVKMGNDFYSLDTWISLDGDSIRFVSNNTCCPTDGQALFYFMLINPEDVVDDIVDNIKIRSARRQGTVIKIRLKDKDPFRGKAILNGLISMYNKATIEDKNVLAGNTLAFIEQRLNYVVRELDSVEVNIERFKIANQILDISEQGKIFLESVEGNDQKISEINVQLSILDQIKKYVLSKNESPGIVPSTVGMNDKVLTELLERLYDFEIQYEQLDKSIGENNPIMISIKQKIAKVKPGILENIENQKNSLQAAKNNLDAGSNRYSSVIKTLPAKERELLQKSRQQKIKNSIYTFLLQKKEEAALSYASTIADSRIVDTARVSKDPVSPRKSVIYFIAFVAPFLAGMGLVQIRDLLNNNILLRSEIEQNLSMPIIGEIVHDVSHKVIVTGKQQKSLIAEQFRITRTNLSYIGINDNKKKILVTSSISGEGKSFVVVNLAISLVLTGKKVVILELDLRKPQISNIFNLVREPGITNYLIGNSQLKEIIKKVPDYDNLFVISSGPIPPNPAELILNEKLNQLFEDLTNQFDYILVDSAPVVPVTDAHLLSRLCDATLYVIRHGYTPKSFVEKMEESNKVIGLKNVAIIYNGVKSRGFAKYGYRYEYNSETLQL